MRPEPQREILFGSRWRRANDTQPTIPADENVLRHLRRRTYALGVMRRQKREPIEKVAVAHAELPGQHPNARQSVVFIQRFEGEVTGDLLKGTLLAAIESAGDNTGLGLHEGGGELRLNSGEVLEAVSFGPKKVEMNTGARLFAQKSGRLLAVYDSTGNLLLPTGTVLSASNSEAFKW